MWKMLGQLAGATLQKGEIGAREQHAMRSCFATLEMGCP